MQSSDVVAFSVLLASDSLESKEKVLLCKSLRLGTEKDEILSG
jgi:hypothetical protein